MSHPKDTGKEGLTELPKFRTQSRPQWESNHRSSGRRSTLLPTRPPFMMDSATLPVDMKCPVDSCEYRPNVSDATLAATLLTIHAQSQHVAMPEPSHAASATAKVEKISRPTVDEGISLEDLLYFEQRWQKYKDATRVAGLDLIYQLLDCCNPDGLRKNLVRVHRDTLASCNEYELLANIKKLAVRTENAMVARDILSKMRQDRDEPVRA